MERKRLLVNERNVLWGLVNKPLLNDRKLATFLNMKISTVTAIKNRLRNRGFVRTVRVPNFLAICKGLLYVIYGRLSKVKVEKKGVVEDIEKPLKGAFLSYRYDPFVTLGFATDYNTAFREMSAFETVVSVNDTVIEGMERIVFPLSNSVIFNNFDFSPILAKEFRFDYETPVIWRTPRYPDVSQIRLTTAGKRVYIGLIEYAGLPDKSVASKINITRQVVSKKKKEFTTRGILKTIRIPALDKLGYELMSLVHLKFNPRINVENRSDGVKYMLETFPHFFFIMNDFDGILLGVHVNYTDFVNTIGDVEEKLYDLGYIRCTTHKLIPISSTIVKRDFDFVPVVRDCLGVEVEG